MSRFKPGESGNPNGRPSFKASIAKIGAMLSEIADETGERLTKTDASVFAAFEQAMNGNVQAIKFLAEHSEGTTAEINVNEQLSDEERAARLATLLDAARARRVGQPDSNDPEAGS